MKIKLLIMFLLTVSFTVSAQQAGSIVSTRIFNITPLPDRIDKVNGLALGLGHYSFKNKVKMHTVNGLNLEINPFSPLIVLFQDADYVSNDTIAVVLNGLHISTGGFSGGAILNGMGISLYSVGVKSSGFTINGLYNVTKQLHGLHISGIINRADAATGMLIAVGNKTGSCKGISLGVINKTDDLKGVQVGLLNLARKTKGIQIGLWNKNNKRSLPFINWNFKD